MLIQTPPGTNENATNTKDHTVLQPSVVPANEEMHQPVPAYQPVLAYQPVTHIDQHQSTAAVGTFPAYLQVKQIMHYYVHCVIVKVHFSIFRYMKDMLLILKSCIVLLQL